MTWPPDPNAPPDPDIQAFFAAIREAGDDTTPRLVFADWLEERGDPRAELVRLQVAFRTCGDNEKELAIILKRVAKWERAYDRAWFGKKVKLNADWVRSSLDLFGYGDGTLFQHPEWDSARRALREGWFECILLDCYDDTAVATATSLGLFATVSQIDLLSEGISDAALTSLSECVELRSLHIDGTSESITSNGIAKLSRLSKLLRLELWGLSRINVGAFQSLKNLNRLERISLFNCNTVTSVLPELGRFPNLRELELSFTNVHKKGLEFVGQINRLTRLELSNCSRLSDSAMSCLGRLEHLNYLDLSSNDWLTDAGIVQLARLHSLETLKLDDCSKVTGVGLCALHKLTNLRHLDLRACPLKSHETRALKKALPNCEIIRR